MESVALGLPALTPILLGVVAFTVAVIQGLKLFLDRKVKWKWTNRIPSWAWWGLSIAIPMGIVFAANLDWMQAFVNRFLPAGVSLNLEGYGDLGTGVVTALAGNGAYFTLKKKGIIKKNVQAAAPPEPSPAIAESPVPEPPIQSEPIPEPIIEAPVEPPAEPPRAVARLLKFTTRDPDVVIIEGEDSPAVYPVAYDRPDWLPPPP